MFRKGSKAESAYNKAASFLGIKKPNGGNGNGNSGNSNGSSS